MNIYIPPTANPQMRLWYYNQAEDTDAKFRAIEAVKYMMQEGIGTQEMNMAQQPKINAPLEDQANKQTDLLAVNGLQDLALQ
jgi:TPR repeat protein